MLQRVKSLSEFDQVRGTRRLLVSVYRFMGNIEPKVDLDKATFSEVMDIQRNIQRGSPINMHEVGIWGAVWQQMHNCEARKAAGRQSIAACLVEFAGYVADAASREYTPIKIPHWVAILILGDIYRHLNSQKLFDIVEGTSLIEEEPPAFLEITKHGRDAIGLSGQVQLPFPVFEFWTPQQLLGCTREGTSYIIKCFDDYEVQMHPDMIDDPPRKKRAARSRQKGSDRARNR